jgi:hypothetical protein
MALRALALTCLVAAVCAHEDGSSDASAGHTCLHDELNARIHELAPPEERFGATKARQLYDIRYDPHGRMLQTTFNNLRIRLDISRLFNDTADTTT